MAPLRLWIDLDNTLYPASSGFLDALDRRINLFLSERCGIPQKDAPAERERLYRGYGATLLGLHRESRVDYDEYMAFVYREDPALYFRPDPALKPALRSLPQDKIVFTNSCMAHAVKILSYLGVQDCFGEIFCLERDFVSKPHPLSFKKVVDKTGWRYDESLFIDDADRNLAAARELGMKVLKVDENNNGNGFPCVKSVVEAARLLRDPNPPAWLS